MKPSVAKPTILSAAIAVTASLAVGPADAAFRLRISDNNQGTVITDTTNTGEINVNTTPIGAAFTVTGIVADTSAGAGGAALNVSGAITAASAGTLNIFVQNTGFTSPTFGALSAGVTGNLTGLPGSSATFSAFVNPMNMVPSLGGDQGVGAIGAVGAIPAGTFNALAPAVFTVNGNPSPISTVGSGQVNFTNMVGAYSLFSQITLTFTGAGSANFGLTAQTAAIPLPSTLLLALIGAPLIALARRRGACVQKSA